MRLRFDHIQSRRVLAIGVSAGLITFGIPPMAAQATETDPEPPSPCAAIIAAWDPSDTVSIGTADQLYCIGADSDTLDMDFSLTTDIDISDLTVDTTWRPIGLDVGVFTGSLDGNRKEIRNLVINRTGVPNVGLFGAISRASISNLTLVTPDVLGGGRVGGLVGDASESDISDVTATNVTVVADGSEGRVGGLIGYMDNTHVTDVSVSGTVTATDVGSTEAGGVVGRINATPSGSYAGPLTTITNAEFTGDVEGPDSVGGVVGGGDTDPRIGAKWMALTNLRSAGTVSSTVPFDEDDWNWAVGGAVGAIFDTDLSEIHSTSDVSSTSSDSGGLIGSLADSTLRHASATGDVAVVISGGWCGAGGLIGNVSRWFRGGEAIIVEDVSASGRVTCSGGDATGGLVGYGDNADFTNAIASGDVIGADDAGYVGGLVGSVYDSTFSDVSATGDVDSDSDAVGGLIGGAYRNAVGDGFNQPRDVTITRATSSGAVRGVENVGGIVGNGEVLDTEGSIQVIESSSSSAVTGLQSLGGIAGGGAGDFVLRDVVSTGAITGWLTGDGTAPSPANYGGLVGYLSATGSIERAYTTSTVTTNVDPDDSTIGSMIGVSEGAMSGLSFTATDPDTLPVAGRLPAGQPTRAEYRSLSQLGQLSTYESWNTPDTVIVAGWVPSPRTTQVWGSCTNVASGLPFLQWQRTSACEAAPTPTPTPSPNSGGSGSGGTATQPTTAPTTAPSTPESPSKGSLTPVVSTGSQPAFRQPTAAQPVTATVTLVPANVAGTTPTRAMRQEATATLRSAPTVTVTANQPVKLMVPGFTPGGKYMVQVKSNRGYVVLGSVEADATGQLQMPVFRKSDGASTTTIAVVSSTGEASYVKVKTTKKRGAGERSRTRGDAASNRR